jgi:hypothetical protein
MAGAQQAPPRKLSARVGEELGRPADDEVTAAGDRLDLHVVGMVWASDRVTAFITSIAIEARPLHACHECHFERTGFS